MEFLLIILIINIQIPIIIMDKIGKIMKLDKKDE